MKHYVVGGQFWKKLEMIEINPVPLYFREYVGRVRARFELKKSKIWAPHGVFFS